MMRTGLLLLASALAAGAADQATIAQGQKEEQRTCTPCHSLRIIHTNRLSRAGWNRELDKMTNWGTKVGDREAVLEYLVANFGDDKPLPQADMSGNGAAKK